MCFLSLLPVFHRAKLSKPPLGSSSGIGVLGIFPEHHFSAIPPTPRSAYLPLFLFSLFSISQRSTVATSHPPLSSYPPLFPSRSEFLF